MSIGHLSGRPRVKRGADWYPSSIDRLIGRGGMGDVYRAEDIELRRVIALKILPEHLVGDPDRTAERSTIWRRAVADGRVERVSNFDDLAIPRFALSPNGRTLLLSRGTLTRDALLISAFR